MAENLVSGIEAADPIPRPARPGRRAMTALLLGLGLALATFTLFSPSLGHGFVDLDDGDYVNRNRIVLDGLSWPSVQLVFTRPHAAMYAPVLWLSYMLDVDTFGTSSARGFHFTNVLLHSFNAGLFFLLLFAWSRKPWRAFFFAALWAWHPLRVESVAWIAERKDVLSGLFFLLCLAAYGFAKRPAPADFVPDNGRDKSRRFGAFCASIFFLALGLLTKPSLVPVPALLLLLDFWPLRRFPAGLRPLLRAAPRLLAEKLPFFFLSAAAAWASTQAHQASDAIADVPLPVRLKTIPIHFGFYLFKIFRPRNLSVLYPDVLFTRSDLLVALLLLAGISWWVWLARRERPNELVGWLWFLGLLAPVIGLVRFGVQSVADRFTYLPAMGVSLALLFALPSGAAPALRRLWPPVRAVLAAILLALVALLAARTLPAWENTRALFANVLRHFPHNYMALCEQAKQCIDEQGDFATAEKIIDDSRLVDSASLIAIQLKALCLAERQGPEAGHEFLLNHPPNNLNSDPGAMEWQLAIFALSAKQYDRALAHANEALRVMPAFNFTRYALELLAMVAAHEKGDAPLALSHARRFPLYRDKTELALPDLMPYYLSLWICSQRREATEYFRRLVDACPDRLDLVNNIAWGLATAEWSPIPPEEVLALARRAQALHPEPHPVVLDTLAAAQANAGDFAAAVETAQTALAAIPPPATPQEAEGRRNIEFRLQEYRNQKPHREDAFRRLWTSMLQ